MKTEKQRRQQIAMCSAGKTKKKMMQLSTRRRRQAQWYDRLPSSRNSTPVAMGLSAFTGGHSSGPATRNATKGHHADYTVDGSTRSPTTRPRRRAGSLMTRPRRSLQSSITRRLRDQRSWPELKTHTEKYSAEDVKQALERSQEGSGSLDEGHTHRDSSTSSCRG